ncbi:MAG TPA: hypothetical protein VF828_00335 [Patescibacteria group bacterium]
MAKLREEIIGYVGPMYAHKTTLFLDDINGREAVGQKVLVVKPGNDNRFAMDVVQSRNGGTHPAFPIPTGEPELICDYLTQDRYDYVGVDEAQFFDPLLNEVILEITQRYKIPVGYTALTRDYRGDPFPTMKDLMSLSTELSMLTARCAATVENGSVHRCGNPAKMTQRLRDGLPDSIYSDTVKIEYLDGRPDTDGHVYKYEPRCLGCWEVADMPESRFSVAKSRILITP